MTNGPYLATGSFNEIPPIRSTSRADSLGLVVEEAVDATPSPTLSKTTICPVFAFLCFSAVPTRASPLITYANVLYYKGSFVMPCYYDLREAISMEKRYFTSALDSLS